MGRCLCELFSVGRQRKSSGKLFCTLSGDVPVSCAGGPPAPPDSFLKRSCSFVVITVCYMWREVKASPQDVTVVLVSRNASAVCQVRPFFFF